MAKKSRFLTFFVIFLKNGPFFQFFGLFQKYEANLKKAIIITTPFFQKGPFKRESLYKRPPFKRGQKCPKSVTVLQFSPRGPNILPIFFGDILELTDLQLIAEPLF